MRLTVIAQVVINCRSGLQILVRITNLATFERELNEYAAMGWILGSEVEPYLEQARRQFECSGDEQ